MKTHANVTEEEFERLLAWLGHTRDTAADRYESIRQGLITVFVNRRCLDAEDLADETINRVAKRLKDLGDKYQGNPERYFYGVAKKIFLEYTRQKRLLVVPSLPQNAPDEETEAYHDCLDECLERLTVENRNLILNYYGEKERRTIGWRKRLREGMVINAGALRARTFRIRAKLEICVRRCLAEKQGRNGTGVNLIE
jgi:DNA-directed RNA polymerase specialized sigma24 family protein